MPSITAIAGKIGVVTINGIALHVENISVTLSVQVLEYAVTGMTADGDGNRWMESITGIASGKFTATLPLDYDSTAADRTFGDTTDLRPGLAGAGTLVVNMAPNYGFSGSIWVSEISPTVDVMGSKPTSAQISMTLNGAPTYINS